MGFRLSGTLRASLACLPVSPGHAFSRVTFSQTGPRVRPEASGHASSFLVPQLQLSPVELSELHADLKIQERDEFSWKKLKAEGLDEDGEKEAKLRRSLGGIFSLHVRGRPPGSAALAPESDPGCGQDEVAGPGAAQALADWSGSHLNNLFLNRFFGFELSMPTRRSR